MSDDSIPTTWPQLFASDIGETLRGQFTLVPRLLADMVQPFEMFAGSDYECAGATILLGAPALEPVLAALRPKLERTVQLYEDIPPTLAMTLLGLLSTLNCFECIGFVDRPYSGLDTTDAIDRIVRFMGTRLEEIERHRAGLAAVALGRTELVTKFVGGKLSTKITPGETFQFNVPAFVRYLAVATTTGATAEAVKPAWLDFVSAFPRKLAAKTLNWPDLLWAGRIYYHGFEKRPAHEVAGAIRELVKPP